MYENNNKDIINELAQGNFRAHKTRNTVAILAVFLTAMLLATIFTAGISLISTGANAGEQTPGPASDGYFTGGYEHYTKILAFEQIEWADYVQKCSQAALHNSEFGGVETRLFAPDDNFYRDNLVKLKEGTWPQEVQDIMISDTMLETLLMDAGPSMDAGQSTEGVHSTKDAVGLAFTLKVMITENGDLVERDIVMNICGIYENPLFGISSIYEEIYTVPAFIDVYNPEMISSDNIIYVKLNNLNPLLLKSDIDGKLYDIADAVQAPGYSAGKNTSQFKNSLAGILPMLVFVLLLMASGYFLIYNVFYISITSDIRWFGMMKTIGATRSQLKKILDRQIRVIAAAGIAGGIVVGYFMGLVIAPRIISMTDWAVYYKAPDFIWIAVFTVLFSWLTVKISARKPLRLAASISPIEAQRFTPKSNKNIFTVISMALSGIIFLAAANISLGFDIETMVARYNQNDAQLQHRGTLWTLEEAYTPISRELAPDLEELSFIEKVDTIYMARTNHEGIEVNGGVWYPSFVGEIKAEGRLFDYFQDMLGDNISNIYGVGNYPCLNMRGNLTLGIAGLPMTRLATEETNYTLLEGVWDSQLFASGEYLILQQLKYDPRYLPGASEASPENTIHAGDVLPLTFYDEASDRYVTKELTVLAVVERAHDYSSTDFNSASIILPDTLFQEIYTNYYDMIAALEITGESELTEGQVNQIKALIQGTHNTQMSAAFKYESRKEWKNTQMTYGIIGFFMAGVLAVIGISNVINTVTANVFAHKLEYAAMQSVGMTRRQMIRLLFTDGGKYCLAAVVFMLPIGGIVTNLLAGSSLFSGFNRGLFLSGSLAIIAVMLVICLVLSLILVYVLNRKSIVERLREIV